MLIDADALKDIEATIAWYDTQVSGIGTRYQKHVKLQISKLTDNPYSYTIRYKNVRCVLVKDFPFLIHFIVHQETFTIEVLAVIHTSRNPEIWE